MIGTVHRFPIVGSISIVEFCCECKRVNVVANPSSIGIGDLIGEVRVHFLWLEFGVLAKLREATNASDEFMIGRGWIAFLNE